MVILDIKEYVRQRKDELQQAALDRGIIPSLAILDGTRKDDAANQLYIKNKVKDFDEMGWRCKVFPICDSYQLPDNVGSIQLLNEDEKIQFTISQAVKQDFSAIIVQLPLRDGIVFRPTMIPPDYDCDGFNPLSYCSPATPKGIVDYLEACEFPFSGKLAVIFGRSNIVGKPLAKMLTDKDMTVALCHSKTIKSDRLFLLHKADLVVCATGQPLEFHRNECPNAFVVDVGINRDENGKLCGDFQEIGKPFCTPVPGGVGLLTRLALLENCYVLCCSK